MLVPGGMAAGHMLGYLLATAIGVAPSIASHPGYLDDLFAVAIPLTVMVLVRSFLGGMKSELAPVRFSTLAAAQVALYVSVELAERASGGIGWGSLIETTLLCGVAAQFAVAWCLTRVVRASHRAGEQLALHRKAPLRRPTRPSWRAISVLPSTLSVPIWSLSRRGPPVAA